MFEKQKGKPRMLSKIASSAQITWSPSVCSFLSTRCHPLSSEKMFPFLSHAKWNKNTLYRWNNRGGKPPYCLAFFCRVRILVAFRHNTSREICSSKMSQRVEWVGWLECFVQSGCVKRRGDVGTSRRMTAPYCFWCFRHQVWGLFLLLRITKAHLIIISDTFLSCGRFREDLGEKFNLTSRHCCMFNTSPPDWSMQIQPGKLCEPFPQSRTSNSAACLFVFRY